LAADRSTIPGRNEEVMSTAALRKVGDGNRPIFRKAEFSCPEFEVVNQCAYFDYQRDRVFARGFCPHSRVCFQRRQQEAAPACDDFHPDETRTRVTDKTTDAEKFFDNRAAT
jgi:hypothetical protein